MRRIKSIHFVGIGGVGMGGIAELLHNQGYQITGSDLSKNSMVDRLIDLGIDVKINHNEKNIHNTDVIVITSAVSNDNPEIMAAKKLGIPVVRRAEMLSELMRFGQGIAISGTHGKTTVTSILSSVMAVAGLDPTFVIGGKLNSLGANAKLGKVGKDSYFVAEADESDASFLHLNPVIAVVTNVDRDHMVTYANDIYKLHAVFISFLKRLPFYGLAVINIDDMDEDLYQQIQSDLNCQIITYGEKNKNADFFISDYKQQEDKSYFTVVNNLKHEQYDFTFSLPGLHNAANALAAIIVANEEGVGINHIKEAISSFNGISRRYQVYKNLKINNINFTLIDDYGHHPSEISVMIDSIRHGWEGRRLVMVFQPHRYSRTLDLKQDFAKVLTSVDELVLLPVYAASEKELPGGTTDDLYNTIISSLSFDDTFKEHCYNLENFNDVMMMLPSTLRDGDIVLLQGAGDIGKMVDSILESSKK